MLTSSRSTSFEECGLKSMRVDGQVRKGLNSLIILGCGLSGHIATVVSSMVLLPA